MNEIKADAASCHRILPNSILRCCQLMYTSKCSECKHILNSEHLKTKHQVKYTIHDLLVRVQNKKDKNSAKSDTNTLTELVLKLSGKQTKALINKPSDQ